MVVKATEKHLFFTTIMPMHVIIYTEVLLEGRDGKNLQMELCLKFLAITGRKGWPSRYIVHGENMASGTSQTILLLGFQLNHPKLQILSFNFLKYLSINSLLILKWISNLPATYLTTLPHPFPIMEHQIASRPPEI